MRFTYALLHAKRSYIGPRAIIRGMQHIKMGSNFHAKEMLWLDAVSYYRDSNFNPDIHIGNNVSISRNVHIAAIGKVYIGHGVLIGSNVLISDHSHGCYDGTVESHPSTIPGFRPLFTGGPICIMDNVWLGDGVVVLAGVSIGEGAIIGANSVVSRDVEPNTINVGSPAHPIKKFNFGVNKWQSLK